MWEVYLIKTITLFAFSVTQYSVRFSNNNETLPIMNTICNVSEDELQKEQEDLGSRMLANNGFKL